MRQSFNRIAEVKGELNLPGDKSISHRAVMFACLAGGISEIHNLSASEDVKSTINCFRQLGCSFSGTDKTLIVEGKGFKKFTRPQNELDAGNSGTTARLLTGILSAQDFTSTIIGDESLSKRPMERITEPLTKMGAVIETSETGTLPLRIFPSSGLNAIEYVLPVPSAQVKSAVLLAGLHLDEETKVIETVPSRNHTENMLNLKVNREGNGTVIYASSANYPLPQNYFVPSDISSAAFFIVLSLLTGASELILKNILLNETRSGILEVLRKMGGKISVENIRESNKEKYGDIIVKNSQLENVKIPGNIIPNIIDEIPVLSLAGLFAGGKFEIRNCKELRYKESDRIKALCENYKRLGVDVAEFDDGFELSGVPSVAKPVFDSFGDHRIAMTFAIASLLLEEGGEVENFECVKISNPGFLEQLKRVAR